MHSGTDAQYEWSCSALDNQYALPDLGGLVEDDGRVQANQLTLRGSSSSNIYVYPIPSTLNCNGTVTALRYCYNANNFQLGTEQLVFTLLTLEESGPSFTISDVISVRSTPTSQICTGTFLVFTGQYCCDLWTLDVVKQFPLPTMDFAFGVAASDSVTLLSFSSFSSQYRVEQYIQGTETLVSLAVGSTITVNSDSMTTSSTLRLFQFVISKLHVYIQWSTFIHTILVVTYIAPPPVTEQPTTGLATIGPITTESDGTGPSATKCTEPSTSEWTEPSTTEGTGPSTTEWTGPTTTDATATVAGGGATNLTSEGPRAMGGGESGSNGIGGIVGGVVGVGVVIALLLVLIVVVMAVLIQKRQTSWKPLETIERRAFPNAIYYGSGKQQRRSFCS